MVNNVSAVFHLFDKDNENFLQIKAKAQYDCIFNEFFKD